VAVEASASMTLTDDPYLVNKLSLSPMLVTAKFLVRLELDFLFLSVFLDVSRWKFSSRLS